MSNIPKLRFPEFTDAWEKWELGEAANIIMGQSPSSKFYTDNPKDYILVQGNADLKNGWVMPRVWTTQRTKVGKKGDLIFSVRAPVGEIGKTNYDVVLGRGVAAIQGNEFIFQTLSKMNIFGFWKTLSTGSTFDAINSNELRKVEINIPTLPEQQKIGNLFKQLDRLITLHKRKWDDVILLKKALLQKMFPKNGSDFPEIRFPEFTDAWEKCKLERYLKTSTLKNTESQYSKEDVLSVSGEFGIVNQIKFKGRSFAGASVENYSIVNTGDVVYTKSPLQNNPYGIIKANKGIAGIVSTLYAVYHPKEEADPEFIQTYFELHSRTNNYLAPLVNKGAKNDMKVSSDNALKGGVIFPTLPEQQKIGTLFRRLDRLITLHKRQHEHYQLLKKALLQQMFV
ncbi:restriction endonuclease subunit S [Avibacterium avium]|uniref:restriction endonuclease subunit S n=1 Tax=Avibacterium avium TaxID=751 RepID=UPI003BF88E89